MNEKTRAPREVEDEMLKQLNAGLAARGAKDILGMEMSQEIRGKNFVLIVTPDVGEPFELLLPYSDAFPGLLETLFPPGETAKH